MEWNEELVNKDPSQGMGQGVETQARALVPGCAHRRSL